MIPKIESDPNFGEIVNKFKTPVPAETIKLFE